MLLRIQQWLPLNPQGLGATWAPDLSFNTAVSFGTNTNWQSYMPETTMSYFSQMVALATHNFWSAAAGICGGHRVGARVRAPLGQDAGQLLGGFHARARSTFCCRFRVVGALLLVSQGAIQNFHPTPRSPRVEGAVQTIPQGPVASQEAIKMIGTNGGGFFNANSAHPFENPTPFSNFLQMLFIFVIPGRADLHVRQDGEGHAAGMGAVRRHEHPVPGRRSP